MDTILRSRHKRAARLTPAVLRGLSLLAACDTDQPIAPETTRRRPSRRRPPTGLVHQVRSPSTSSMKARWR